jgi:hypothetical protein
MINQTTEISKNDLPSPSDFCDGQYDPRPRHLTVRRIAPSDVPMANLRHCASVMASTATLLSAGKVMLLTVLAEFSANE